MSGRHNIPVRPETGARGASGRFNCGCSGGGSAGSALLETFPTEDWPALRGFERDGGLLATPGAIGPRFHLVVIAWRRGSQRGCPLGLAGFATFGFVGELLIVEEQLFARCKDEVSSAVDALQYLVLEFHGEVLPSVRDSQAHGRGKLATARRTGLSVHTGNHKFQCLGTTPWVRPTMHQRMALHILRLRFDQHHSE